MTGRYSALSLPWEGLNHKRNWEPAWRDAMPKQIYQAMVIGGGRHGLAVFVLRGAGARDMLAAPIVTRGVFS